MCGNNFMAKCNQLLANVAAGCRWRILVYVCMWQVTSCHKANGNGSSPLDCCFALRRWLPAFRVVKQAINAD